MVGPVGGGKDAHGVWAETAAQPINAIARHSNLHFRGNRVSMIPSCIDPPVKRQTGITPDGPIEEHP